MLTQPQSMPAWEVDFSKAPFLVIWEMTQACGLACLHCRANANARAHPDELTSEEGRRLIDEVSEMGTPLLVFSGGDPTLRAVGAAPAARTACVRASGRSQGFVGLRDARVRADAGARRSARAWATGGGGAGGAYRRGGCSSAVPARGLSFDACVCDDAAAPFGCCRLSAAMDPCFSKPFPPFPAGSEAEPFSAIPGQALAYKMGQLEIRRLRSEAEQRLGEGFDLKGFHEAVLSHGAMPLPLLAEVVEEWMRSGSGRTS